MDQEQIKKYLRWQDYRIKQLSYSINVFLGFSVASLIYAINLKLSYENQHHELLIFIILCWSCSAVLGSVATVTRLLDFRYTARKIRTGGCFNDFIAKLLGSVTWGAFWGQLITYVAGSYFFIDGFVGL
jgi:hypothetical protein